MGRAKNPTETMAMAFVTLRAANADDPDALRDAVADASAELGDALAHRETYSKAEAANLLEVSPPTLDKWIASGVLPLEQTSEFRRPRLQAKALLELAREVRTLRRMGRKRGLLAEALSRLEQEDPAWREEFDQLYGKALAAPDDEYVSAAPGANFGPDD